MAAPLPRRHAARRASSRWQGCILAIAGCRAFVPPRRFVSVFPLVRAIDRREQILEIMLLFQSIGAPEPLSEHAQIMLGEKADRDDAFLLCRLDGIDVRHGKAGTIGHAILCRDFSGEAQDFWPKRAAPASRRGYMAME
ncbi:hypothetical protein [Sphingomonas sp.]|uniref:hypothetical protein n=1 Tax=Sphingomonas sp. TaxID=28214 RepID=UPI0025E4A865|nr:hypothetical protein [Sphingomonas sp.]